MKKITNGVELSNRKLIALYELSTQQLEDLLDTYLDTIITNEVDDPQFKLKITTEKEGTVIEHFITSHLYNMLSNHLNRL